MSTLAPNAQMKIPSSEKSFTLLQAIALILVSALVFTGAGYLIGKTFFWKSLTETRIDQQLKYYEATVQANPKDSQARVNYGYTLLLKERYDDALQQLKVAETIDPKFEAPVYNEGLVYKGQKQYDQAIGAFTRAAKLAPRDYKNYLQMGVIYNLQGKYKDAVASLNKANQNEPGSSDIIYQIGFAAEKTGDKEGAKQMYQQALNFDPNYKDAKDALARLGVKSPSGSLDKGSTLNN